MTRLEFVRLASCALISPALLAPGACAAEAYAQPAANDEPPSRQLTVMAIHALKGEESVDPKLASVESRLSRLLPNHAFSLWEGKSRRVAESETIVLDLKNRMKLTIRLIEAEDADGKVQIEARLETDDKVHLKSTIRTPPNQLFFLDHKIDEPEHLLIAVGAR
ncbi:hypothetical protein GC170_03130 [bacterium]|nr:hypothetical protein [bacterium]